MKKIKLLGLILFTGVMTACTTNAKFENMQVNEVETEAPYANALMQNIRIERVSGGRGTNPLWVSRISNEDFRNALRYSLEGQNLYADNGRYFINADILDTDQPIIGWVITASSTIKYQLTDSQTNSVLYEAVITAPFTSNLADSLWGPNRVRIASEGSARTSVTLFLEKLSEQYIVSNL